MMRAAATTVRLALIALPVLALIVAGGLCVASCSIRRPAAPKDRIVTVNGVRWHSTGPR